MKTGVILYITGDHGDCNMEAIIENGKKRFVADRVEIISANSGHCDIDYAWWNLIVKGMHRVICNIVEVNDIGSARFSDRSLQLCG